MPSSPFEQIQDDAFKHRMFDRLYLQASSLRQVILKNLQVDQLDNFFASIRQGDQNRGFLDNRQKIPFVISLPQSM